MTLLFKTEKEIDMLKDIFETSTKPSFDHKFKIFRQCSALVPAATKVASIGCGKGRECRMLSKVFSQADVVGVDINQEVVKSAAAHNHTPKVTFKQELAAEDTNFDAIFCMGVFCNDSLSKADNATALPFSKFNEAVTELASKIKVGGLLVITKSNFRFCDADAFASFEVAGSAPQNIAKFGKDNAKISGDYNDCIFKKVK